MATTPVLIYCAGGSKRYAQIAIEHGYAYGARLPGVVHHPLYFADQDWKRPDRAAYMAGLAKYKPTMATVLDWERAEQFEEVMDWCDEASQHTERVIVVAKVYGEIARIPRRVNGKDVVLAYSTPTSYGGTQVPTWEFGGWPVHILGGTPQKQMEIYAYLRHTCDVVSVDGNAAQKMSQLTCFWVGGTAKHTKNRYWPQLKEMGEPWAEGAPYEAFRRSCVNIAQAWASMSAEAT